jgi:hypothetical protein
MRVRKTVENSGFNIDGPVKFRSPPFDKLRTGFDTSGRTVIGVKMGGL